MCGILGFSHFEGRRDQALKSLERGIHRIAHRGPDDRGVEYFYDDKVGLAHSRLSIQDISKNGRQPMVSSSGRFWIVFNGEVYNYRELRSELRSDYPFKSESDTEVLLAAFERWGVEASIEKFRGMFAFCVYDRKNKQIFLVRDRIGIKPLYYGNFGKGVVFASELKAIVGSGLLPFEIDRGALDSYLTFNFVEGENSMVSGIKRLIPGHYVKYSTIEPNSSELVAYWNPTSACNGEYSLMSADEWKAQLKEKLLESVRMRMISDVPLGAFLSGGIDSSLIVAMMQELSERPVQTFTIRSPEVDYDESTFAERVAEKLGTEHHSFTVTHKNVLESIEGVGASFDEPMADVSIIPTLLVCEKARKHVTVVLTGDGGDEVFGGYNRYLQTPRILRNINRIPSFLRRSFAGGVGSSKTEKLLSKTGVFRHMIAGPEKMQKVSRLLQSEGIEDVYYHLITRNPSLAMNSPRLLLNEDLLKIKKAKHMGSDLARQLMRYDIECYLRYDILPKLDIASMMPSLEARVPFLDHELYEMSRKIPSELLFNKTKGKLILREILADYFDPNFFDRPKMGFGIPMAHWLRTSLKDWARDCLFNPDNPSILDKSELEKIWEAHMKSKQREDSEVWPLLLFFSWHASMRGSGFVNELKL